ncbi:threonine--tRNA ligase [Roseospira visakhapatnamensis]|uniref:Threonine--tRNA ligase n=1 Tax=Roseospira visakhapatnamensis TaxID=390880 RepID=A0A7W6RFT8_9PROT|nr:threonine--tRNA ligase [Roseospira visakhapatnamensis]MBB4267555.1 threonyl-tRNA synthetase [Roseospira visakhapatnamensis]
MVAISLPDGSQRQYDGPVTGLDIARDIGPGLAKASLACTVDGAPWDLTRPIDRDAAVTLVTGKDEAGLELIRHDAAHVMAEAVQELYPGTQVTIGPAIENGFYYDFARDEPFTPEDLAAIEARMRAIVDRDEAIVREEWDRDEAIAWFKARGEHYKAEIIADLPAGEPLTIYRQGDWLDLCRGPHLPSTGKLGKAFKLTKLAGAYWRGDSRNPMLQRIYGTAWATDNQLKDYLHMLEEAEKRDHRRLGREMDLFHFEDYAPGSVFWHDKGWTLFQTLIQFVRRRQAAAGFQEVNTPDMMDRTLWEVSGHWQNYRENMFTTKTEDERDFALKPMNCPGHMAVYKCALRSYRDLPLKIAEFGKVHRYEPSGALHGLMRVRSFTQDDAHVFCTPDQLRAECLKLNTLILGLYEDFGFEQLTIKLATRPEKRVGSDDLWDAAEGALQGVLDEVVARSDGRVKASVNPGEGVFYGPKLEYVLRDAIGRDWQCGTVQVDFNLPGRFDAGYVGADGDRHVPVMIHRAMFGSLERFTGILIEHYAGRFPLWLAPTQVVVATITGDADGYASEVAAALRAAGLRVDVDLRNEKINYKVREHSHVKVPVIAVVGKREAEERTVALRRLGGASQEVLALDRARDTLKHEALPPDLARRDAAVPATGMVQVA